MGTSSGAGGCDDVENNPLHCGECGYACSTDGVDLAADDGYACVKRRCSPKCKPYAFDLIHPAWEKGEPDDGCETIARRVFVTADPYPANLGDASSYDAECEELAKGLTPPGRGWTAWISDAATSAEERLIPTDVPYVLLNNEVLAWSWEELLSEGPISPIRMTDDFTDILDGLGEPSERRVWTGTLDSGDPSDTDCIGWSTNSAEEEATFGLVMTDAELIENGPLGWTDLGAAPCNSLARLYCFEHP